MEITGYTIHQRVGVGATSEVFEATRMSTQERVALKRFSPLITHDPEMKERLEIEADTLAHLRHPNIVALKGVFQDRETWGLELEYVEGQDLNTWAENHPKVLLEPRLWILAQIAQGLAYAHAQEIIHRDLKPENVLVSDSGEVKLTDFGLARTITRATITRSGVLIGSLAFMPPEILRLEDSTPLSDIYSFGVIAYQLITGELPHQADSPQALIRQISDDQIISPQGKVPALSTRLSDLILSCLERNPSKRPKSVWHIHAEIMHELSESGLIRFCTPLVMSPASSHKLSEALKIKHESLMKQITNAENISDKLQLINALRSQFPTSEEIPKLMMSLGSQDKSSSNRKYYITASILLVMTLSSGYIFWPYEQVIDEVVAESVAEVSVPEVEAAAVPLPEPAKVSPPKPKKEKEVAKVIKPKIQYGHIQFETPDDVTVFVDGTEVPKSSRSKWRVKPGNHSIRMIREGFNPISGELYVKEGEVSVVRVGGIQ